MSLDIANAMDAISTKLAAVTSMNFAYPPPTFQPPCCVIGYPEVRFDSTMARGMDECIFPVWYVAGKQVEQSARALLAAAMDGTTGVKAALEADETLGGKVLATRVVSAKVEAVTDNSGIDYLAIRFEVEVYT